MLIAPLGSGSAGNSYFFESDDTRILIDAGFGPRETEKRLRSVERSLEHVRAILITHEHYDHIRGAAAIARKFAIPIYLSEGTLGASRIDRQELPVVVFENNTSFRIGDLLIHARKTVHDAADPSCFVVEAVDGTRAGLASDLGCVDQPVLRHLTNCDALLFESNHDLDMLRMGTYPWGLKRRIMSRYGHLSNDDSMAALLRMIGAESKMIYLIHLSEKNNHESIVRAMADAVVTTTGAQLDLLIASQREPMPMLEVARRFRPPRPAHRPRPPAPGQMSLF
ncbi:MAG TPA: MBL fold metallo-hydrolase [Thermoanaerobaculia bacterium]|nr:MBL fold metallo-hydrolase [Thermoanaerobaculia bacterium]